MDTSQGNKLLAIGVDAGDLDFIRSRMNHLPTFRRLLDTKFLFQPDAPKALPGSAWQSFYSGSHPGHHGMYQHLVWDAQKMGLRLIGPDWSPCRPFWTDLEDKGRKVIIVDVPYSFPIFLKRGIEITDWGTHGQTRPLASNRSDVHDFLRKFGRSPIGRETPINKTGAQLRSIHRKLLASVDRKRDLILALMKAFDWDLFIATFAEVHRAGHVLYDEADARSDSSPETPLLEIYRRMDQALSQILEGTNLQRTTVVLFSVQGMARNHEQGHLLKPFMDRLNQVFLERHMGIKASPQTTGGAIGWLRRSAPSRVQYAIGEAAPDWVRRWVVEREIIGGIQWSRTPGFSLRTDIRAEIRMNLAGRESMGLLEPGSSMCREYVKTLRQNLLALRDQETGDLLVDEVLPIQELFPGPRSHALPDFAITWRPAPPARRVASPGIGELVSTASGPRGGDHTDFGFAAVSPSQAIAAQLSSNNFPNVKNVWDLGNFFSRLDEIATA